MKVNPIKPLLQYSIDRSIRRLPEGVSGPCERNGTTYRVEKSSNRLEVKLERKYWEEEHQEIGIVIEGDLDCPSDQAISRSDDRSERMPRKPTEFSGARMVIGSIGLGKIAMNLFSASRAISAGS